MRIKTKEELIQRLKALREQQKISINKVAQRLGTSHARVKAVEAGESEFLIDLLLKYAAIVGYSIELVPISLQVPVVRKEKEKEKEKESAIVVVKKADGKRSILIEDAD